MTLRAGKGGFLNRMAMGWTLVKFDDIKEEPARDANGRCIPCKGTWTGVGQCSGTTAKLTPDS